MVQQEHLAAVTPEEKAENLKQMIRGAWIHCEMYKERILQIVYW